MYGPFLIVNHLIENQEDIKFTIGSMLGEYNRATGRLTPAPRQHLPQLKSVTAIQSTKVFDNDPLAYGNVYNRGICAVKTMNSVP